ncbi:hypothetical protein ABZ924_22770 [Streptomyces sp. NPDC046876]|uniref:hypothetical protein n=1 Tax=Streptomyces sp. NPDC046876 TaxID=3155616 RepID=UPI0033CBDA6E
MARWGLLVEQNLGFGGEHRMWSVGVLGHVEGTREEALAELGRRAQTFAPVHPRTVRRRVVYRTDDGFLAVLEGAWQVFHCRFSVAEQVHDSAPPPEPKPQRAAKAAPEPARGLRPVIVPRRPVAPDGPAEADEEWDAGVPDTPSWLGRGDLQ